MRFGKIQNIEDIDKAFEELDKQHSELLGSGESRVELQNKTKFGSS